MKSPPFGRRAFAYGRARSGSLAHMEDECPLCGLKVEGFMRTVTLGSTGITTPQNAFGALPIQRACRRSKREGHGGVGGVCFCLAEGVGLLLAGRRRLGAGEGRMRSLLRTSLLRFCILACFAAEQAGNGFRRLTAAAWRPIKLAAAGRAATSGVLAMNMVI